MLGRSNEINWDNIEGGWGIQIPSLIHRLTDDNSRTRDQAYANLRRITFHQSSVFEVSLYTVPFLIELINIDNVKDKDRLISLLDDLIDAPSSTKADFGKAIHNAVYKQIGLFITLLKNGESKIYTASFCLLCHFPEDVSYLAPLLVDKLQIEPNSETKAHLISRFSDFIASELVVSNKDIYVQLFQNWMVSEPSRLVNLMAAIGLTKILKLFTPPSVIEQLVKAMAQLDMYKELGWDPLYIAVEVCEIALSNISSDTRIFALTNILNITQDDNVVRFVATMIIGEILIKPNNPLFHREQKLALQSVLNKNKVWEEIISPYKYILETKGIFHARDDIIRFLAQ